MLDTAEPPKLSVFFFSSADRGPAPDRYRALLDTATLADTLGLHAVWIPERHFHPFGGLFPNPAVVAAALATQTHRIRLRAGSVVAPLHHLARVAEEWSVVDALSNGRAGLSLASGWNRRDFVLGNVPFGERRARTLDAVDTLRALWAGDAVEFPAPDGPQTVRTYPAPTRPDIPLWLTAMSGPDTFRLAGERGLNLLTSYIQQTREQLAENIRAYRKAFAAAGTGRRPHVTLMLHACVAATRAEALSVAEEALVTYQDSFLDLARSGVAPAADRIGLARFSARQYATERGLIGSPEEAARRLRQLAAMGVDEVACLVDFGLSAERVAETLRLLADCRAFV